MESTHNPPNPDEATNDQAGEASPGVISRVQEDAASDVAVSPTPEPPETAETTEAARKSSAEH
jgi:hypothetical protein